MGKDNVIDECFAFLRRVDPTVLTLYPLQLANVERLERNDAVFIFDEVGCGKTISSGLMALSYLEQNVNKEVLVITINSLVKTGQFKNDWFNKLPFTEEQKNHITVINDHVKKIEKASKKNWGLIIVDEAQLFLADNETGKGEALKNLKGEKVVFLTATPIRKKEKDIDEYIRIAGSILKKEYAKVAGIDYSKGEWEEEIRKIISDSIKGKEIPEENICARFEPSLPVTRYFKDTVRALEKNSDNSNDISLVDSKKGSKRRFASIWRIGDNIAKDAKSKEECLFLNIQDILNKDREHHFVIFSTKQQAKELGKYFGERNFREYNSNYLNNGDKTYRVITGDNSDELGNFGKKDSAKNPTILFVNYQIAEQGLNLPGFDYVVNFQISRFPSRLEQRFGRIDRLDRNGSGKYETINICYVLDNILFDTSTLNFYFAMEEYLESIIPFLPSRNMILNEEILLSLENVAKDTKNKLLDMLDKLKRGEELSKEEKDIIAKRRKSSDKIEDENEVEAFNMEENLTEEENIKRWLRELERIQLNQADVVKFAKENGIIQQTFFSDEIFVKYDDTGKVKTFTNRECVNAILKKDEDKKESEYERYCSLIKSLSDIYKVKELHDRNITYVINMYLIMAFALGDLNSLYPLDGYKRQMKRILQIQSKDYEAMLDKICKDKDVPVEENNSRRIRYQYVINALSYSMRKWEETNLYGKLEWDFILSLSNEDKVFLIENAESFLLKLPIYKYLYEAGQVLFIWNGEMCGNGNLTNSWWAHKHERCLEFLFEPIDCGNKGYRRYYIEGEKGWEPSPFFKLFYHYERMESPFFLEKHKDENNIYKKCYDREKECKGLLEVFGEYIEIKDSEKREEIKKKIEEKLHRVECLNKSIEEWYREKEANRAITSWYGQIFNESVGKRKKNWRIKNWYVKDMASKIPSGIEWYARNNNPGKSYILEELLFKKMFKKKLDYWSYNLIKEMLEVEGYININPEIKKIYSGNIPEYGFDFESIGITDEKLCGIDSTLTNRFVSAIIPWLLGNL